MAGYRQPGVVLGDHHFTVPLDHGDPAGERIEPYGREVASASHMSEDRPWLV
ncbi:hypothetical protein [Streptomyces xantholiticus]|uniref:hypothetical protein n=1 Tax=Streptomyces xantholiticus TaxID=68285 RepID=UPI0019B168DF|nr:hypothetical protein GCM10010381_00420 [Streptomyces xantholiticus]